MSAGVLVCEVNPSFSYVARQAGDPWTVAVLALISREYT